MGRTVNMSHVTGDVSRSLIVINTLSISLSCMAQIIH